MPQIIKRANNMSGYTSLTSYRRKETQKQNIKILFANFIVSFLLYYELEMCNKNYILNGVVFTFVNIFIIYSFIAIIGLFTVKKWIAATAVSIVVTAVAAINFYTVLFRNQPVSTLDISNIGTAMDVLGSYKPGFHLTLVFLLLIFAASIFVIIKMRKLEKEKKYTVGQYLVRILSTLILSFVFFYVVFFAKYPIKPELTLVWSWEESYHQFGYLASSEELLVKSFNVVRKPENYNEKALFEYAEKNAVKKADNDKKPDIILILNETFYDLEKVTKLDADKEAMPFIKNLDNKIFGYSFVPGVGGGTNRSEYELLTSNTLCLMPGITPFSFLDLKDANSIVNFLKEQGYSTWASHCAPALNYSRGVAYPKLGFDKMMFDPDFKEKEFFGKRPYVTDSYMYDVLIDEYNKMPDGPRFMYTLTIQNHGGWGMNPPEADTVHAKADFGEYDSEIDEYLTCVSLSDAAFEKLVNYYKDSDRDVIICMVGDHAPSWISDVADKTDDKFTKTLVCATPFVIWANFDIEQKDIEYTSLPYLVPLTLKSAGMKISPYYGYMLNMFEKYPVVSANNFYCDGENKMYSCIAKACADEIKTYFDMVYNNASKKVKRADDLFRLK